MQSSMLQFCDECGAANAPGTQVCLACKHTLSAPEAIVAPPMPVTITPLQVTAGAPVPTLSPAPGSLLHKRYHLLKEIGQGGFGSVYRARDRRQYNRLVAIKQIGLSGLSPHEIIETTALFHREVTLLSKLKHRGLPKIYEHFTEDNCWYLVMEYLHGQTLEEVLKRSRRGYLPIYKTLRIGQALADILGYLHANKPPVIFRDVKPANIMLTRTGRIYLIDFGIARLFSPGKRRDTGPLGSPGFAAPEQYGKTQTDARTDIYGLGATLQTLLIGRDPLELRSGMAPQRPTPLSTAIQELLTSTMETDPLKRPQKMLDLEISLEKFVSRRRNFFNCVKGLLFGGIFLIWHLLGIFLAFHTHSDLIVAFNTLLLPAIFATAIWQIVSLIGGYKRWFASGVLFMLFIVMILTLLVNFNIFK